MGEMNENERIIGNCLDMCPREEVISREKNRRLSVFEMVPGTEKDRVPKADYRVCIKEYSRSAAGCKIEVSKIRPAKVLIRCVEYLIDNILDQERHGKSWLEVYEFMSDRLRGIRQDMIVQRLPSNIVIEILKKAVRFHIVVMEECKCDEKFNRASCLEQLNGCLLPLMDHVKATSSSLDYEFHLYFTLLNIKSVQILHNSIRNMLKSDCNSRNCENKRIILDLAKAKVVFNYHKLFKIFERLPYIASCSLLSNLSFLRLESIRVIMNAFSCKNSKLPLSVMAEWLKFDSCKDTERFCNKIGLETDNGKIILSKVKPLDFDEINRLEDGSSWRLASIKKFKSVQDYVRYGDKM